MFKKTKTYRVDRHSVRKPCGYFTEYSHTEQRLVEVTTSFFGVRETVIDTEIVPEHALISLGAFGDTGGWMSKFAAYMK